VPKTFGRVRGTFAVMGLVSIVVIYAIVTGWNPLPGWASWLETATARHLSTPAPLWSKRTGDEPDSATVLAQGIVVSAEGSVEVRDPTTGIVDWSRPDSWAGVAGDTQPVVVVGKAVGTGFDVYDVASGVRIWGSNDKAGVWPYDNMILILTCSSASECVLRSVDPATGHQRWSTSIRGDGTSLLGFRHSLAAVAQIASAYADPLRAVPVAAPARIGLPMDDQVHVIDTGSGRQGHVFTSDASTRVVVTEHDVISSSATMRGNQCYYTIVASSPETGSTQWQQSGIDLRTASGLGCEANANPYGGGDDLLGIDNRGRDIVLSAGSGSELFRAKTGERVIAMDSTLAVLRSASGKSLRAIDLSTGKQLWTLAAPHAALVGVAPGFVLVADPTDAGKLTVYDRHSGVALMSVTSNATILGIGTTSVVVNIGRTIGPIAIA
jgi:outer membrane protein assembly factor BamB